MNSHLRQGSTFESRTITLLTGVRDCVDIHHAIWGILLNGGGKADTKLTRACDGTISTSQQFEKETEWHDIIKRFRQTATWK